MIEDKLLHAERLRLECVAQANMFLAGRLSSTSETTLINTARVIEEYVRGSDEPMLLG